MNPVFRPVRTEEQDAALALWETVFSPDRDYFARYFRADPWHQDGDCLGAWVDGQLASAVHLCRRPLSWDGRALLCGAIANVATLAEYRRQGLSRELLSRLIRRMEEDGFAFSMLFTGSHRHYAALGWEQVRTPRPAVTVRRDSPPLRMAERVNVVRGRGADALALCSPLYEQSVWRPLHFQRPDLYFRGWVGWSWGRWAPTTALLPDLGYAVSRIPEDAGSIARVLEWRAASFPTEALLLAQAVEEASRAGRERIVFEGLPQHGGLDALRELGEVEAGTSGGMMLRNVSLAEEDYREIVRLYGAGEAVWWPSDGF
jgi:predicted N-acetyltransferase YhbS